ncbi:MAG: SBBP repeat-containing protein [Bacteroidota bacterium]
MKKRFLLSIVFLSMCTLTISAQPGWQWARSAEGEQYDQSSAVATDASGNVYVTGYFASDSITFGTTKLTNAGSGFDDLFIVSYDASGNLRWAESFGGSDDDKGTSIVVDPAGNIFVTGYYYSPTITFGTTTLTNNGNGDMFILKIDYLGNFIWARGQGGAALEIPYAVTADAAGNAIVAGRFSSNLIAFGTIFLTQQGSMDVFIVKYDPAGTIVWATGAGGGSNDEAYSVGTDQSGNIYIGGYFNQTISFGSTMLTTIGISDGFVAKYGTSGALAWARKAGSSGDDRVKSIAVDANGNCYATGFFSNNSFAIGSYTLNPSAMDNSFIAKYDSSGTVQWAHGVNGSSKANALALKNNQLYIAGSFNGDTLSYGTSQLLLDGSRDFFLVNCSTTGNAQWAVKQTSGGGSGEFAYAVTADVNGDVYIAGDFDSDPIAFGTSNLINASNGFDMFVAKLGSSTGIDQIEVSNEVNIYPNPGRGNIRIKTNGLFNEVEIYSVAGNKIFSKDNIILSGETTWDAFLIPPGIYIVKLISTDKIISRKFVVE